MEPVVVREAQRVSLGPPMLAGSWRAIRQVVPWSEGNKAAGPRGIIRFLPPHGRSVTEIGISQPA